MGTVPRLQTTKEVVDHIQDEIYKVQDKLNLLLDHFKIPYTDMWGHVHNEEIEDEDFTIDEQIIQGE